MRIFYIILFVVLLSLNFSISVYGDDAAAEAAGPQLFFEPPDFLDPESMSIEIDSKQVVTEYIIKNLSNKKWQGVMHFTLPEVTWDGIVRWYPDQSFRELEVLIDDQKIEYQIEAKAYFENTEITGRLIDAGLDPNEVNTVPQELKRIELTTANRAKYRSLMDDGIIISDSEPNEANSYIMIQPNWGVINHYFWRQIFNANKSVSIKYAYHYQEGYETSSLTKLDRTSHFLTDSGFSSLEDLLNKTCTNPEPIADLVRADTYSLFWISLNTKKINWNQSIKKFNFFINIADTAFFTCINGRPFADKDSLKITMSDISLPNPIIILKANVYIADDL